MCFKCEIRNTLRYLKTYLKYLISNTPLHCQQPYIENTARDGEHGRRSYLDQVHLGSVAVTRGNLSENFRSPMSRTMMVYRTRRKIIRTVLCCVVYAIIVSNVGPCGRCGAARRYAKIIKCAGVYADLIRQLVYVNTDMALVSA